MDELEQIDKKRQAGREVYFVCDAMTGQDAVSIAKAFNDTLELDGVILTKLDGDARGGAALSIVRVTGVPIKFVGIGEKLDALEAFHPERLAAAHPRHGRHPLAGREAPQETVDQEEAERSRQQAAGEGRVHLDDFREQIQQIKKMGPIGQLLRDDPRRRADGGAPPRQSASTTASQAHRGDHRLDDPRRAPPAASHRRPAAAAASPRR